MDWKQQGRGDSPAFHSDKCAAAVCECTAAQENLYPKMANYSLLTSSESLAPFIAKLNVLAAFQHNGKINK